MNSQPPACRAGHYAHCTVGTLCLGSRAEPSTPQGLGQLTINCSGGSKEINDCNLQIDFISKRAPYQHLLISTPPPENSLQLSCHIPDASASQKTSPAQDYKTQLPSFLSIPEFARDRMYLTIREQSFYLHWQGMLLSLVSCCSQVLQCCRAHPWLLAQRRAWQHPITLGVCAEQSSLASHKQAVPQFPYHQKHPHSMSRGAAVHP